VAAPARAGRTAGIGIEASTVRQAPLRVLQVDPSLFTAPYDAALSSGLVTQDVCPVWATRRLRDGEEDLLAPYRTERFFYPRTDGPARRTGAFWKGVKGVEHLLGLRRLARIAGGRGLRDGRIDLVHFQWAALPLLDARAIAGLRRSVPVVMTVHDIVPFNGRQVSALQRSGYDAVLAQADRLIVHTIEGRDALIARGLSPDRIHVVPHGLLPLIDAPAEPRDDRWRVVLFGRLQAYKGADLLIEALGRLDPQTRAKLDVLVAGEAMIDVVPLLARAEALGLGKSFTLRPGRLSEGGMAALLRSADAFVFPYRAIDASGVLHQVAELGRWIIASDLGAFRAMIEGTDAGALIRPENADVLAEALAASIGRRPGERPATGVPDWPEIGERTRAVYVEAIAAHADGQVR
jgi:glycosyltransferase involved in cell wall biosynthesis